MAREILLGILEDSARLRSALAEGFALLPDVRVLWTAGSAREAHARLPEAPAATALLLDVHIGPGESGIGFAVEARRSHPRLPVVFYSIEDQDQFFREFRASGIISHFAYVRKSNYLLPHMVTPLLRDAMGGRSFVDPEVETRFQEVASRDRRDPLALLEPNERQVAELLALGLNNEQIAERLGFRDRRTISRVNGRIYTTWGLSERPVDEKIARLRAVLILREGRLIQWDDDGAAHVEDEAGNWVPYRVPAEG